MFLRATSVTRSPLRGRPAIRALAIGLVLASGCVISDPGGSDECPTPSPVRVCSQGEERPCSDGPTGTDGAPICAAGTQVCNLQQTGFDACLGQVLAAPDDCAAPTSFSCDAQNHCGSVSQPEAPFGDASDAIVSVDAQGNLTFAIHRRRGSGLPSLAIQKRAPDGTPIWNVDVAGLGDECAADIVGVTHALDDDVLVFGYFGIPEGCTINLGTGPLAPQSSVESSAFVARYAASDGRPRWVRTWPGGIAGLAADASGGFVIGGPYLEASWLGSLELPVPTQGIGAYVARLDANGEPVWVKTYDDNRNIHRVAVDGAGAVHALSQRPGERVEDVCMAMSSVVTALEADGTPRFERPFGGDNMPVGLAVDTSGRVAVLISFATEWGARGPLDLGGATVDGSAFLAVLDPAQGHIVWARSLYEWEPGAVMVDAHDDVILAGVHRSRVTVARYTRDGALFSLASGSEGYVTSAARTTASRVWVTSVSGDAIGARTAKLLHADP